MGLRPDRGRSRTVTPSALACACMVAVVASACSARPSLTEASRFAEVLSSRFFPLEAWAHRALAAEMVPSSVDEFDQRLFSPTSGMDDVVDAWLVRRGTSAAAYSAHGSVPIDDDDRFTRVRLADRREVRVAVATMPDPRTSAHAPIAVILVEHTAHPGPLEEISFTVAFTRASLESPASTDETEP